MDKLRSFLNSIDIVEQRVFAERCGTTINYLRNAMSSKKRIGETICINIERESEKVVCCEDLRPDVDWAYLRGSVNQDKEAA